MFGDLESPESTVGEEMRIVGKAIKELKKDKSLSRASWLTPGASKRRARKSNATPRNRQRQTRTILLKSWLPMHMQPARFVKRSRKPRRI